MLNVELVTVNTTEGAAYGATLLAGVGVGHWVNVEEACTATIKITGSTAPQPVAAWAYEPLYRHYQALYPALKEIFHYVSGGVE